MTPDADSAYRFVAFLVEARVRLGDFASTLGRRQEVARVTEMFDLTRVHRWYPSSSVTLPNNGSPPTIEFYVDAELRNNQGLGWCMQIYFDEDGFVIESYVGLSRDQHGSNVVAEFATRRSGSLDEFELHLSSVVTELTSTTDLIHRAMTESGYWWEEGSR